MKELAKLMIFWEISHAFSNKNFKTAKQEIQQIVFQII